MTNTHTRTHTHGKHAYTDTHTQTWQTHTQTHRHTHTHTHAHTCMFNLSLKYIMFYCTHSSLTIDPLAGWIHNGQVIAGASPNDKIKRPPLPDLLLCDIFNVTNMADVGVTNLRDLWVESEDHTWWHHLLDTQVIGSSDSSFSKWIVAQFMFPTSLCILTLIASESTSEET